MGQDRPNRFRSRSRFRTQAAEIGGEAGEEDSLAACASF